MAKPRGRNNQNQVPLYAWISLVAFLCCLAVLLLLIPFAERLTNFNLVERFYYLVLVLMGLASAVFLFGVLPSSAAYEGKLLGGKLRLGGAVVGAALVVVGGYFFAPNATTFPLTVYVRGPGGPQDIVLHSGSVMLELGPELKSAQVDNNGQAYFPAIPTNFRGQQVPAWVQSDTYESADPKANHHLDGSVLRLDVRKKVLHYPLAGTVSDDAGKPLSGVRVALPEYHVEGKTNEDGRFEFQVVAEAQQRVDLVAQKEGYQAAHQSPTLGDTGLNFSLQRSH